jgi:nitrogen regulatory protein PII
MKMVLMMADAARIDVVRRDLASLGAPGYTVIPVVEGGGRTGIHTGDRVHPGALALVMVVDEDARADRLFEEMAKRRDAHGDLMSRLFLMPVERQA